MRRAAALIGLGLPVACGRGTLPPQVTSEQVVTDLAPPLAPGASVEGPSAAGVRRAVLQPGYHAGCGAPRDALVAPPGTTLRFHVDVPPDGVVRFSTGVEGDKQRHPDLGGADFRVMVDGQKAYARVVNPATPRLDRCWVDRRAWAGRSVDIAFETRAERPDHPLAGTVGWSHLRLVRQQQRERQVAGKGPNVLLLLVDTLRADRLGIYGANPSPSPALDQF